MAEPALPTNTNELLADIRQEWTALMDAVGKLPPEQFTALDAGCWSPKDNLAHLTEWMKILQGFHMDKRPAHEVTGLPREVTDKWDQEVVNRLFFERNRDCSGEAVREELERVYSEVIARLESMPFEELMEPRYPEDPEKRPLLGWVLGNTSDHFAEHRAAIEKLL
jgi:hypothetical protein